MKVNRNLKVSTHIFDVSTLRLPYRLSILFPAFIYGKRHLSGDFFIILFFYATKGRKNGGVRVKVFCFFVTIDYAEYFDDKDG